MGICRLLDIANNYILNQIKKEASNPFKDILSMIKVIPTGIASF